MVAPPRAGPAHAENEGGQFGFAPDFVIEAEAEWRRAFQDAVDTWSWARVCWANYYTALERAGLGHHAPADAARYDAVWIDAVAEATGRDRVILSPPRAHGPMGP